MIALHCKHLLSNCEAKRDSNGKWRNFACAGEERFGSQKLNLTNFANGNSINAGYYFVLFLLTIYAFILCGVGCLP